MLTGQAVTIRDPAVASFIEAVKQRFDGGKLTYAAMLEAVYGLDNPLIVERTAVGRPKAVVGVAGTDWRACADLLDRAWAASSPQPEWGLRFTITVREAAARAGITTCAVASAITRGRLQGWKKLNSRGRLRMYVSPEDVDRLFENSHYYRERAKPRERKSDEESLPLEKPARH